MTPIEIYLIGYILALITLVLGTIYIEKRYFQQSCVVYFRML